MPNEVTITALAHVCMRTTDLAATERFYSEALGFPLQFRFDKGGKTVGFYLKIAERQFLEVFEMEAIEPTTMASAVNHFCLETPDIEALHARLDALGYQPTPIKEGHDHSLQCWVNDPSGARLEFHQYGPRSLQLHGGVAQIPA